MLLKISTGSVKNPIDILSHLFFFNGISPLAIIYIGFDIINPSTVSVNLKGRSVVSVGPFWGILK